MIATTATLIGLLIIATPNALNASAKPLTTATTVVIALNANKPVTIDPITPPRTFSLVE